MKHILSLSGGKDSTVALWLIVENNLPLDEVICAVLPFEEPEMNNHLKLLDRYLKRTKGLGITFLRNEKPIEPFMSGILKTGKNKGIIRGFPLRHAGFCWISRDWKIGILQKWQKQYEKLNGEICLYIGFAADEKNPKRQEKIRSYVNGSLKNEKYPLVDFGYTEEMCRSKLKKIGFSNSILEEENRTGCWFCQKSTLKSRIRSIKRDPINRLNKLKEWTKLSGREIYLDITIAELETRINAAEERE